MDFKMRFGIFLFLFVSSVSAHAQFVPVTMWNKKGIGYFVLTLGVYPGNFGGLSGADSTCLTDLTTNNWKGKAEAGTLTSARVKGFMCNESICTNPLPNTTYAFSKSGSTTIGGATFITNAAGEGPNNSTAWSGPTYFGSLIYYWTGNRSNASATNWGTAPFGPGFSCNSWTTGSVTFGGYGGDSSSTGSPRWNDLQNTACNQSYGLICMVNP